MSDSGDRPAASARLQILAAALLFSTGGAAIKATTLTAWQVACFRSGVAALAVLALLPASRRAWRGATLVVGLGYAATLILFVQANKLTTAANTTFLQSTGPIYIMLLGPLLLKEPIRRRDFGIIAALAAGMVLFFVGVEPLRLTAPDPLRGNVYAALSGVCWALTVSGLRWIQKAEPHGDGGGAAAVAVGNLLAFGFCVPWVLPVAASRSTDWAVIAYLGVFQIGLAYALLTRGLRHVPALDAALLMLVEPVFNPLWAWAIHREAPSAWSGAGGAIILGATIVKTWIDSRDGAVARPSPPG